MSSEILLGSVTLLPLKEAAEYVPYSRDYVARLARDAKIVATQIDRAWFVDVTSLQNFYTNAELEESVRSRHLSLIRKRDLEVKALYQKKLDVIAAKQQAVVYWARVRTGVIVASGVAVGFLGLAVNQLFVQQNNLEVLAAVQQSQLLVPDDTEARVVLVHTRLPAVDDEMYVSDTSLVLKNGIVIVPTIASSTEAEVEDFFSDPVSVDMISPTTGVVRSEQGSSSASLPFVRIPTGATVTTETP